MVYHTNLFLSDRCTYHKQQNDSLPQKAVCLSPIFGVRSHPPAVGAKGLLALPVLSQENVLTDSTGLHKLAACVPSGEAGNTQKRDYVQEQTRSISGVQFSAVMQPHNYHSVRSITNHTCSPGQVQEQTLASIYNRTAKISSFKIQLPVLKSPDMIEKI